MMSHVVAGWSLREGDWVAASECSGIIPQGRVLSIGDVLRVEWVDEAGSITVSSIDAGLVKRVLAPSLTERMATALLRQGESLVWDLSPSGAAYWYASKRRPRPLGYKL